MSTKKNKKAAIPFALKTAQNVSFANREPEPYYTQEEQEKLNDHRDSVKAMPKDITHYQPTKTNKKKKKQRPIKKDDSDDDSQSSESSESSSPSSSSHVKPKNYNNNANNRNNDNDNDEKDGGMLKKMVSAVKDMGSPKPKPKSTRVVIELPRDILTAYFLMRLPRDESRGEPVGEEKDPYWNEYSMFGKVCLFLSVLIPYGVQCAVMLVLLAELATQWEELVTNNDTLQNDFWWNSAAFSVLFIYMWKDLAQFYFSVWFYINWLSAKTGSGITKQLKNTAKVTVAVGQKATDKVIGDKKHVASDSTVDIDMGTAVEEVKRTAKFVEFRLWLLFVVFLYVALTAYSVLSIPIANTLIDKLEVSLSVFFVLEVDDWAYELFIAQANILEDDEFDVIVKIKKDRQGHIKKQQKHLAVTIFLVTGSVALFWVISIFIL